MSKLLIGISGKMCVGKSTLTKGLLREFKHIDGTRVSVAGTLYELQDMIYDRCNIVLDGDKDRDLLRALGLWGRDRDHNFWLDRLKDTIDDSPCELFICDDVRFPNEADFFEKNGILIRLHGKQRGDNVDVDGMDNITETALDEYPFDNFVSNEYGIDDTLAQALAILKRSTHGRKDM